ncbi:MAG: glycine zipper 2TM domain-containing protein [Methylobacter sp.]|nr:glycine zipper 2TM domain-containing protein [Methylobacter sp.]
MKKLVFLIHLFAVVIYLPSSYASGGKGHGHAKRHYKHHSEQIRYYPEQSRYPSHQDPRVHQGLAGGVVGSVLGYEIGHGDPVATGLGAAAGSYLGNEIAGRR